MRRPVSRARRAALLSVAGATVLAGLVCLTPALASTAPPAGGTATENLRVTVSDGVSLQATVTGAAPLAPRPTIVEFSPYGNGSGTFTPGPAYNFLLVQIRGTGSSDGSFDALGPRTQLDVQQVLQWACHAPFSDGTLGLNGFSASAITIYNSLHLSLPCVKAALLKSGTYSLYRDLLWPGGVSNFVPGVGVAGLIAGPALEQGPDRLQRAPLTSVTTATGLATADLSAIEHPTLDAWWQQRQFQGDVNHLPILMIDGFFDVESRGAFQAYQELRGDGAHLLVVGGHDGAPAGTDDGNAEAEAWFDHYLRGVDNGVTRQPAVQLLLAKGDRVQYLNGAFERTSGTDWPLPGTHWVPLALSPARSGTAHSLNDGTLTAGTPAAATTESYPAVASLPTATDVPNAAIVGAAGLNQLFAALPALDEMNVAEPQGLSFTTAPLRQDVQSAGPLDLDVPLSTTTPGAAIWAVLCDVAPDGTSHPLTVGRLSTAYPDLDPSRSLYDPVTGDLVQPYGVYDAKTPPAVGQTRLYHVEFWPVGNDFQAGHRIRLDIIGASGASTLAVPGVNSVLVGAGSGARLQMPVLPGSDLLAALGAGPSDPN